MNTAVGEVSPNKQSFFRSALTLVGAAGAGALAIVSFLKAADRSDAEIQALTSQINEQDSGLDELKLESVDDAHNPDLLATKAIASFETAFGMSIGDRLADEPEIGDEHDQDVRSFANARIIVTASAGKAFVVPPPLWKILVEGSEPDAVSTTNADPSGAPTQVVASPIQNDAFEILDQCFAPGSMTTTLIDKSENLHVVRITSDGALTHATVAPEQSHDSSAEICR